MKNIPRRALFEDCAVEKETITEENDGEVFVQIMQ